MTELSHGERRAIASLQRLAKRWPKSLWLFSASGTLLVMRSNENGDRVHKDGGEVDAEFIVEHIHGIPNDGGDF